MNMVGVLGEARRLAGALAVGGAVILVATGSAFAQMPRSLSLATHGVGTLYNALGTGIATVLTKHTTAVVRVQPFAGPPAWLPAMDQGQTQMGVLTAADAVTSWTGTRHYKRSFRNTRLIVVGGSLQLSYFVAKDSPMKTVADLKGKRVPAGFAATPIVGLSSEAGLANGNLSLKDVVAVPVSSLQVGNQAFIEGRVDAGWQSVGSPGLQEADARRGGVRFLTMLTDPAAVARMADVYPGSYPSTLKAGSRVGIVTDTAVLTNDIYLVGAAALSDEAAYQIAKALWEHNDELNAAHPQLAAWTRERMVSEAAYIPYHPGVVRLFKEKGVWSAKMEALQQKLLAP
jgi:TRAP transporter TAXI family solute receptor